MDFLRMGTKGQIIKSLSPLCSQSLQCPLISTDDTSVTLHVSNLSVCIFYKSRPHSLIINCFYIALSELMCCLHGFSTVHIFVIGEIEKFKTQELKTKNTYFYVLAKS